VLSYNIIYSDGITRITLSKHDYASLRAFGEGQTLFQTNKLRTAAKGGVLVSSSFLSHMYCGVVSMEETTVKNRSGSFGEDYTVTDAIFRLESAARGPGYCSFLFTGDLLGEIQLNPRDSLLVY